MAVRMTVQRNVRMDSEPYNNSSVDYDGESGEKVSAVVPALSTNHPIFFGGFDPDALQAIWFKTTADATLDFVMGTHALSIVLDAGGVFLWTVESGSVPFDAEVTALEVSCTDETTITGRLVQA